MNLSKLDRIKYIAYCLSGMPPEKVEPTYEDLIYYARFQLSVEKRIPFNDTIFDSYTDEELLVEWYAILFYRNEELRNKFEITLNGGISDDSDFLTSLTEKEPESISFKPEDIKTEK